MQGTLWVEIVPKGLKVPLSYIYIHSLSTSRVRSKIKSPVWLEGSVEGQVEDHLEGGPLRGSKSHHTGEYLHPASLVAKPTKCVCVCVQKSTLSYSIHLWNPMVVWSSKGLFGRMGTPRGPGRSWQDLHPTTPLPRTLFARPSQALLKGEDSSCAKSSVLPQRKPCQRPKYTRFGPSRVATDNLKDRGVRCLSLKSLKLFWGFAAWPAEGPSRPMAHFGRPIASDRMRSVNKEEASMTQASKAKKGKQINRQTASQPASQPGRQTNRQTNRQTASKLQVAGSISIFFRPATAPGRSTASGRESRSFSRPPTVSDRVPVTGVASWDENGSTGWTHRNVFESRFRMPLLHGDPHGLGV